jgi:undecaprenyl-diphosphatase
VEGITEFIPVSSTAHLLLSTQLLGLGDGDRKAFWDTFSVLIQLGAILAVVVAYFGRLWGVLMALPSDPAARRFVLTIVAGFVPAAIVGLLLHDFIKDVLFNSPVLICVVLIVGGVVLMALDRYDVRPVHSDAMRFPIWLAFVIGLFQCLAIVPGVSRSGATIAGALLMRCEKRSAAEFSFFLAIPTMLGAFALDFYQNAGTLSGSDIGIIAVGFVVSFLSALFVVKTLIAFVGRHGFTPFGWWRIVVGALGLVGLWLFG